MSYRKLHLSYLISLHVFTCDFRLPVLPETKLAPRSITKMLFLAFSWSTVVFAAFLKQPVLCLRTSLFMALLLGSGMHWSALKDWFVHKQKIVTIQVYFVLVWTTLTVSIELVDKILGAVNYDKRCWNKKIFCNKNQILIVTLFMRHTKKRFALTWGFLQCEFIIDETRSYLCIDLLET